MVKTAKSAGVVIDFSKRTHYYNTNNAHRLIHWAEQFNKQSVVNEMLIPAYFKQGQDVSDIDVLLNIVKEVGLDKVLVENVLRSNQLTQALERKRAKYQKFKIRSIPAFVINESSLISGSHSVEFFEKTLSEFLNT